MKTYYYSVILGALLLPGVSSASVGGRLMPQCAPDCTWGDFIQLANNALNFLIYIAVIAAAIMFSYAGFLYLTSGGSAEKVKKAHGIFLSVAIGIVITLVAWLAIDTLLQALTGQGVDEWSKPGAYRERMHLLL